MKTVVFTYNRYETLTTPMALDDAGVEHTVLCHTEEQKALFVEANRVDPDKIVASGAPKGLTRNRQWFMDNCVEDGEWVLMLVDDWLRAEGPTEDIEGSEFVDFPWADKVKLEWARAYGSKPLNASAYVQIKFDPLPDGWPLKKDVVGHVYRKLRQPLSVLQFIEACNRLAAKCDSLGSLLGGFAGFTNPIFRQDRWVRNVLADGRVWVVKKSGLRFDQNVQLIDDVCWCAQNIMNGTGVVVDNWVLPSCSRYTKGSFGSINDRMVQKMAEVDYLVKTYPILMRANKVGWPAGSHVKIKPSNRQEKILRESKEQLELSL